MNFEKNPHIPILMPDETLSGWFGGFFSLKKRSLASYSTVRRGRLYYFSHHLSRYDIAFRRWRRYLYYFESSVAGTFAFSFLILTISTLPWGGTSFFHRAFWAEATFRTNPVPTFLILMISSLLYLFYILNSKRKHYISVETRKFEDYIFEEMSDVEVNGEVASGIPSSRCIDISRSFTKDALRVIDRAYIIADRYGSREVGTTHLFYALLSERQIEGIFLRMYISVDSLKEHFRKSLESLGGADRPTPSNSLLSSIFYAYERAYAIRQEYVNVTELIESVVMHDETIRSILYDLEVDQHKLTNVVEWVRIRIKLSHQYSSFRRAAVKVDKHGIDRAMTAIATPFLNRFSQDITMMGRLGGLDVCVGRDKEIDEIFRVIESGKRAIVLVGEHGVGKKTLIDGVVARMIEGDAPKKLIDKRFVEISVSSLLAGTTLSGAEDRLLRIFAEVRRAKNVILFISNIDSLVSAIDSRSDSLDVSDALAELLSNSSIILFASTTKRAYVEKISGGRLGSSMMKVDVQEMDEDRTIQVLESRAGIEEYRQNVLFSYASIEASVSHAKRFLYDRSMPESAIELMAEAASYAKRGENAHAIVTSDDVASVISEKMNIPKSSITERESEKLLRLEDSMHQRVVGQDVAVSAVANALRRARAGVSSTKHPIASFLFVGPTGVGKTELAKTLADVYFGGEDHMIRFDMSEFQDSGSIYRLIGEPNKQGTGLLTEAVRRAPHSLILLDELEKTTPEVLNLFLQVFDDGRLTDSVGRVVDFTNSIIITTSNAGTSYIEEEIQRGTPLESIRDYMIRTELKKYYRPEFLNRFDGVIVFRPLSRTDMVEISKLLLTKLGRRLEEHGLSLKYSDGAIRTLIDIGYDREFGARPMRRAIQEHIENKLAEGIIAGSLSRGDTVVVGDSLGMEIEHK
jgi:ATP-dependent Clp protease ATP-binding subunit ClpC